MRLRLDSSTSIDAEKRRFTCFVAGVGLNLFWSAIKIVVREI